MIFPLFPFFHKWPRNPSRCVTLIACAEWSGNDCWWICRCFPVFWSWHAMSGNVNEVQIRLMLWICGMVPEGEKRFRCARVHNEFFAQHTYLFYVRMWWKFPMEGKVLVSGKTWVFFRLWHLGPFYLQLFLALVKLKLDWRFRHLRIFLPWQAAESCLGNNLCST